MTARDDGDNKRDDVKPDKTSNNAAKNVTGGARPKITLPPQPSTSNKENAAGPERTGRKRKRQTQHCHNPEANSIHPFIDVLEKKMYQLGVMCNKIGELSETDLVLCNKKTGINNYSPNLKFADMMDMAAKELVRLSKRLTVNADLLRQKVIEERDKKRHKQDIVYIEEITDPSKKNKITQDRRPTRMRYTREMKPTVTPARAYVSSDEDMPLPTGNDPDTRFMYVKDNQNNINKTQFLCNTCNKVFRDSSELNNHLSQHQFDIFRCLKCNKCARSRYSFEKHLETHNGTEIRCKVCDQRFDLKTSLINHMQKHSESKVHCPTCDKTFTYRQNGLEHIAWAHRKNKECPCPVCSKMYQMPTQMRSHRTKCHGPVRVLVYDETS